MRFITATSLLFLTTTALAGPSKTVPGLERVCAEVAPEVTTAEVLSTALDAITDPSCDHHNYADGKCKLVSRSLASSTTSALGLKTLGVSALEDGSDGPVFFARASSLAETPEGEGRPVTVLANGKPLLTKKLTDKPVEISGFLRFSKVTGKWSLVLESHGAKLSFPVTLDGKSTTNSATVAVSELGTADGSTSTLYDVTIERSSAETDPPGGIILIELEITFQETTPLS